jgi:hypothetical protein
MASTLSGANGVSRNSVPGEQYGAKKVASAPDLPGHARLGRTPQNASIEIAVEPGCCIDRVRLVWQ